MNDYEDRLELVKLALSDAILISDELLTKPSTTAVISIFERLLPSDTIIKID